MTKAILTMLCVVSLAPSQAFASGHGSSTRSDRAPPQVWQHEPGPGDRLDRFQVIYVDDHSCPAGQIKKFTAGWRAQGVKATRECITRS